MSKIESFLATLQRQKNTSTVTNPYLDKGAVNNLRLYLEYMLSIQGERILLVGEAPGYKGCGITGIPFSSGKVLTEIDHPLFHAIRAQLVLPEIQSENTAAIVWRYLSDKNTVPLFWNAFPFHPHPRGNRQKNRAPNAREVARGLAYLKQLYELFKPQRLAGVGLKGTDSARRAYPELSVEYIRHPSYGGKVDFVRGMDKLLT